MVAPKYLSPELPADAHWLGTSRPLTHDDLRGRVVLLDFWTACCINCLHTLQLLNGLEKRHRDDPFVIIGVHSPKYPHERDPQVVEKAIDRYNIRHPVVLDPDHRIWHRFGIRAWPSHMLLDAEGQIASMGSGEPDPAVLEQEIADLLQLDEQRGLLKDGPPDWEALWGDRRSSPPTDHRLRFPTKVHATAGGNLAIADTGHNRILICEPDGHVHWSAGTGQPGMQDGPFESATFSGPRGLESLDHHLYVADTGNHAIRCLDLNTRTVTTAAGDGHLGRGIYKTGIRLPPKRVSLRSPWDLEFTNKGLAIAMAGSHQIWLLLADTHELMPLAGTGQELLLDGPFHHCCFSQPSGLALGTNRNQLYVVDSEASAIRQLDLESGQVLTLVGLGLFTYGDRDGTGREIRLQHPLGITSGPLGLMVSDSYNRKIKKLDPLHRVMTTLAGPRLELAAGSIGWLDEPDGLTQTADGRVVIADTNNHRLVTASGGFIGPFHPFVIR